ncbi:MFS transporter [Micromonospora sp. ALFpr18c]|nr:MFS transporter [Micromonospora sp. ALFpr18c]
MNKLKREDAPMSTSQDASVRPVPGAADAAVPLRRNRNFQALWSSEALAAIAKETAEFAYPLLILASTGSALWAGLIAAAQVIVAGLVSLPAGQFADRFDRKKLLLTCNLTRAVLLGVLYLLIATDNVNLLLILLIAISSSVFLSLSQPAGIAAIKALVPPEQVSTAMSQNSIRFFGATLIGPPVGGWLFAIGRAFPYLGAAVTFVVSSLLLLLIKKPLQAERTADDDGKRHAKEGFRLIRRQPILFWTLLWTMGSNMVFNHTGIFIAIAATGQSESDSSALIGIAVACAGIGGLTGAFIAAPVLKKVKPSYIFFYAAWIGPVAALLLAFVPSLWVMGLLVGLVFVRGPVMSALTLTYVSVLTPDKAQGRVLGAVFFLSLIVQPIGLFGIGALFDAGGPAVVFGTVCTVATLIALVTFTPTMRSLPRLDQLEELKP